jgi:hypothetical protein
MQNCGALIYASSKAASSSRWMPWELGYFDGFKPRRVAVFPLVPTQGASFTGQEYLGLYPYVETFSWTDGTRSLGIRTGASQGSTLRMFIRDGVDPR